MTDLADRITWSPDETDPREIARFVTDENRRQRREDRKAAEVFARVCADGDADLLYDAAVWLDQGLDSWRYAMLKVAKLPRVSAGIQAAFLPIWIEHKMLPLTVGNRSVLARALRLLLPGGYQGPPLTLYRGANWNERRWRRYGFSWTTDPAIARNFGGRYAHPNLAGLVSGVVMRTSAPPEAVLLIRPPEDYYDEGEVVVDPWQLGRVFVHERVMAEETSS